MSSRTRLAELPFLAATLAMALALVLPWMLSGPVEEPKGVEIAAILPWAVPEPVAAEAPVQLAGQTGVAQP